MAAKYVFVTGGVLSGLGKGIVAASIGNLFRSRGYKVFLQKFDPYLNVDAGTLNPAEHGECFVTADGAETDLDLGHYERFLDVELSRDSSVMSGSVYRSVIEKERLGKYLGKTLQVIPHVTDEIKSRLYGAARKSRADILITEIGGTVGDIESPHFVEAARQVALERSGDVAFVHLGFLPYLQSSQETKTKPMQNSIIDLRSRGIHPHLVFCRADQPIGKDQLRKIALFAGLREEAVIGLETVDTVYAVPLMMAKQKVDRFLLKALGLQVKPRRGRDWEQLVRRIRRHRHKELRIGLVGKYMSMSDTYFSVLEALKAAGWQTSYGVRIELIDSEELEKDGLGRLEGLDGICAPGGFGERGVEGIVAAIGYARAGNIPYLGLCLGMQLACVEYARTALDLPGAHSTEFGQATNPVIDLMNDQITKLHEGRFGGTMRLGSYICRLTPGSKASLLYRAKNISERHRHRYEFNNRYLEQFAATQEFVIGGVNPESGLVEMIELKNHPFFIACQFHPEFKSRPNRPHPLFAGFINAAIKRREKPQKKRHPVASRQLKAI